MHGKSRWSRAYGRSLGFRDAIQGSRVLKSQGCMFGFRV